MTANDTSKGLPEELFVAREAMKKGAMSAFPMGEKPNTTC